MEAYRRWRSGESDASGKVGKPHRRAMVRSEGPEKGSKGDVREVDVKKLKVSCHSLNCH